jgi:hypothetical protein
MFLPLQLRQLIRTLFLFFLRIAYNLGFYTPPPFIPSDVDVYEKKKRVRFLESQENEKVIIDDYYIGEDEKKREPFNENIDPVFYDRKELSKVLETKNNVLERVWNSRILYESTPRGNIVMTYDVYKDAFSYYSDQTGIPYKVLNAVAMKYVIIFKCRDFFVDESISSSSPFIQYTKNDEKKEQDKKNETMAQLLSKNNQSLPFVKFKNRQTTTQPSELMGAPTVQSQQTNTNVKEKEYINNRFIYKGRMQNWSPLQKPPPPKPKSVEVLDYKTFRNSRVVSVEPPIVPIVPIVDAETNKVSRWWRVEEESPDLDFWREQSYELGLFGSSL